MEFAHLWNGKLVEKQRDVYQTHGIPGALYIITIIITTNTTENVTFFKDEK